MANPFAAGVSDKYDNKLNELEFEIAKVANAQNDRLVFELENKLTFENKTLANIILHATQPLDVRIR